jgi:hypothetical protein
MNRVLAFALVASIAHASAAFAGEGLLASGSRHVQQLAVTGPTAATPTAVARPEGTGVGVGRTSTPSFQAEGSTLSKSGMGKGKKAMIYIGLAVGFAASVWTIDHNVLDVTPSSLGTRKD